MLRPRIHGMTLAAQGLTLSRSIPAPSIRADTSPSPVGVNPVPVPRTAGSGFMSPYEALSDSQDRTSIPFYSNAVRSALQGFNRERLAGLGQYLYDNDGLVGYAVDTIATYCTPIIPQPASSSAEANDLFLTYFTDWCKRADFTGRFHFDMLQRLSCKAIDTVADILPVMTAEHGFPQVNLIEGWRVNSRALSADVLHRDGVRIDKGGTVLGFYVVDQDEPIPGFAQPSFIPASQGMLLYDPDRYSSYRGISPIRRGSNDIRDKKDIKGFEKLACKIASALAGVLEGGVIEENVWGDDDANQPPANATQQERRITKAELLGGDIPQIPAGSKLTMLSNTRPGDRVLELLEYLGACFIYGLGIPPAFFIDAKLTGPNQRSVNGKAQRMFDNRQLMMASFLEWAYVRVIAWGIAHDGLPAVPGWHLMEWQGPPKVSIDEGKDAQAWREDVGKGLMTRQNHFANRALNWKRETNQGFDEDDYILTKAGALAAKHKVSIETILARWGYGAAKAAPGNAQPQTQPGQQPDSPEEPTQTP